MLPKRIVTYSIDNKPSIIDDDKSNPNFIDTAISSYDIIENGIVVNNTFLDNVLTELNKAITVYEHGMSNFEADIILRGIFINKILKLPINSHAITNVYYEELDPNADGLIEYYTELFISNSVYEKTGLNIEQWLSLPKKRQDKYITAISNTTTVKDSEISILHKQLGEHNET